MGADFVQKMAVTVGCNDNRIFKINQKIFNQVMDWISIIGQIVKKEGHLVYTKKGLLAKNFHFYPHYLIKLIVW